MHGFVSSFVFACFNHVTIVHSWQVRYEMLARPTNLSDFDVV